MQITPYLFFPGTCGQAVAYYAEVLKSDPPEIFYFKDMPAEDKSHMPGTPETAIMNAVLKFDGGMIMASDAPPQDAPPMAGISIHLDLPSVAEAQRVFAAFSEGGEVGMPIGPTFWASAFGTVKDRFGTRWMISVAQSVTG